MKLMTKYLGEVTYSQEDIITFAEGLPGFEHEKNFVILLSEDKALPFHYLQSIGSQEICFIITNPFLFMNQYDFELPESDIEALGVTEDGGVNIYCMTIIKEDIENTYINASAPIVISVSTQKAKQLVLDTDTYGQFYIFASED